MSHEENKAVARRHFEQLWAKGDLDVADEIYSPDAVGHSGASPDQTGYPESEKQIVIRDRTAFPDAVLTIEDQIAEDDRVLTRWTVRATHLGPFYGNPPTGREFSASGFHLHRVAGGKIVEIWALGDTLGVMSQLGLFPAANAEGV